MWKLSTVDSVLMILILGKLWCYITTSWLILIRYYNKTDYSGLETHISNSYANALLQVMRFTPLIRNLALQHTATACISDLCLLCEMGFLVDMLEKAGGFSCQATNMLKTLGYHPQGMIGAI